MNDIVFIYVMLPLIVLWILKAFEKMHFQPEGVEKLCRNVINAEI